MKKQLLSLLLCLVLICALLPQIALPAQASPRSIAYGSLPGWVIDSDTGDVTVSGTCGSSLTWILNADTGLLTVSGTGSMDSWDDFMITELPWYLYRNYITGVTLSDGVTSIGDYAFAYCTNLESVTIGNSVMSIGYNSFSGCSGLTSVFFSDSVTSIGEYAFFGCTKLTGLSIPDSVTSIGDYSFRCCPGLDGIWVSATNANYSNDTRGVLFNKNKTRLLQAPCSISGVYNIPGSVTSLGNYAFYDCNNLTGVTIPTSVTSIGSGAFSYCTGLTGLQIPDSVTILNFATFSDCSGLTSMTIPDTVTSIGNNVFENCTGLTSITFPEDITAIGDRAFKGCTGLTSVTIPDSVTSIRQETFCDCTGLTSVTIPDSVGSIGDYAFSGCTGLTSIPIPGSVSVIGSYAFSGCTGLTSVFIPGSVSIIDSFAFSDCTGLNGIWVDDTNRAYCNDARGVLFNKNQTVLCEVPGTITGTYTVPDSVTSIGTGAFYDCTGLTGVTFPDGLIGIGRQAFCNCTGLTSIIIPDRVLSISSSAFCGCFGLTAVLFLGNAPNIGYSVFQYITVDREDANFANIPGLTLYCMEGKTGWSIPVWKDYPTAVWDGVNPPQIHTHTYTASVTAPTCVKSGVTTHACACGAIYTDTYIAATGHTPVADAAVAPTCAASGLTEGSHCCICNAVLIAQGTVTALAHTPVTDAAVAPTCTAAGLTEGAHCSVCNAMITAQTMVAATGHDFSVWTQTVAPTCIEQGLESSICSRCAEEQTRKVDALGHTPITDSAIAPTCTASGLTEGSHCSVCNEILTAQSEVAALGHAWDSGVVTTAPTTASEGVKTYTCTRCKQTKTETIEQLPFSFLDVDDDAYYADAVYWAVGLNITNGVSDTLFAPNMTCTRGQVVTFLWRAAGEPTPSGMVNPFRDVKSGAYYYNAVLWAVEQGITAGTSANTFSPNAGCTRGQVATFLWRYEEMPYPPYGGDPFTDVKEGDYYRIAVLWASYYEITKGTSVTTFSPNNTCTRGQIVTFLYRDMTN